MGLGKKMSLAGGGKKKVLGPEKVYRLVEMTVTLAVEESSPLLVVPVEPVSFGSEVALGANLVRLVADGFGSAAQVRDVVAGDVGRVISVAEQRAVVAALRQVGEAKLEQGMALGDVQRRVQQYSGLGEAEIEERGVWHEGMTEEEYELASDPWIVMPDRCRCR